MIMVSACLCGENCKYNGGNNLHPAFLRLRDQEEVLLVCPEKLGGLSLPRSPAEILNGDGTDVIAGKAAVINREGTDVSSCFLKGARETLALARSHHVNMAILRRRSPSCGSGLIYDGTFSGQLRDGNGVTAALLKANGIKVISDEEFLQEGELGC